MSITALMKNLFETLSAFRARRNGPETPIEPPPRTADDIDFDRVVWDPGYRRAAQAVLSRESRGATEI